MKRRIGLASLAALALALTACELPATTTQPPTTPSTIIPPTTSGGGLTDGGGTGDGSTTVPGPDLSGEQAAIDAHIRSLAYDPETALNVQPTGGQDTARTVVEESPPEERTEDNILTSCSSTRYDLASNFDEVAILRPTDGIVFPGALVKANGSLLDGVPEPIAVDQGPITMSVDLPGIGAAGRISVDQPTNSTVQVAVDDALASWNQIADRDGYVNAANSSYQYSSAYSSQQAALDVGLNVEWATGAFNGRLQVDSQSEKRVTLATFKQAFYTVAVDTPSSPAAMFGPTVTVDQVAAVAGQADAPAYVASVVYGRILMVRMETSREVSSIDAEAALDYAATVRVNGTVDARYDEILEQSKLEVVTLGGNAAVSSTVIDPTNLRSVITGDNAVYSTSNPGVPIAYTVRHLNDNSLAKLGYTTEYTATECVTDKVGETVTVTFIRFQALDHCEDVFSGPGDFGFTARVQDDSGRTIPGNSSSATAELWDGEYVNVLHEVRFTMPWQAGSGFTVTFRGSEWDPSGRDESFNNVERSRSHQYNPDTNSWTNLSMTPTGLGGTYPQAIQLETGSSACKAELHYVVDFS